MKYYVVDAFTKEHYHGNPAGVCLLEEFLSDELMQSIAFENNLAETAYLVKRDGYYDLRWFTPELEIDLCGHATLGSAHILFSYIDTEADELEFHTKSGVLTVTRKDDLYTMDFPNRKPVPCDIPPLMEKALGTEILEAHISRDLLLLVKDAAAVAALRPDFEMMKKAGDFFGVIVTAKGDDCDFVSRYFAPDAGINEDPVTGSSHSTLIPFWGERLNKTDMKAKQLSQRGGVLKCSLCGDRVKISGNAVTHLAGEIII